MTQNDLVKLVVSMPDVRAAFAGDEERAERSLMAMVNPLLNDLSVRHDWDFVCGVADELTIASEADYTLRGNSRDARAIINIRYSTDTSSPGDGSFAVLQKFRPVDMDHYLTTHTSSDVVCWCSNGRDGDFPRIRVYAAPSTAGEYLRYRYLRNNLSVPTFPDTFVEALRLGLARYALPVYGPEYERQVIRLIGLFSPPGGETNVARLAPHLERRNQDRGFKYGYNGGDAYATDDNA